jgi:hypothetical protein
MVQVKYYENDVPFDSHLSYIVQLRVCAWQEFGMVTLEKFPNGFYDHLETHNAFHFTIEFNNSVVAAARVNILKSYLELPHPNLYNKYVDFNNAETFAFLSRLVVHPNFRNMGFSSLLDAERVKLINTKKISTTVAIARLDRAAKLKKYGFNIRGRVESEDDYMFMDNQSRFVIQM